MEEMKGRISGVNMSYYVNIRTIQAVHQALAIPLPNNLDTPKINGYRSAGHEEEDGDIVEEEVAMYNDDV
jgi:intraflagellar transport protein 140